MYTTPCCCRLITTYIVATHYRAFTASVEKRRGYHVYALLVKHALLAKPILLHLHFSTLRSFGNLLESAFNGATRRARVIVGKGSPGLGALGEDVTTVFADVVSRTAVVLGATEKE
jgi:hypothetical protein